MKTVLITGGNSGIGKATVAGLAQKGWQVVFTARSLEKAESVKKEIIESSGNEKVDYIIVDLTSLKQVKDAAETFKKRYDKLDVLVNNAGVCLPERRITGDGMEESFQINHLSHFILTNLLVEELKKSDNPRIINLSSAAHKAGKLDIENLHGEKNYSSFRIYADTKLYNILFTLELAERLKDTGITVNALHPGVVGTNFAHEFGGIFNFLYRIGKPFMITPEKGAITSIYLADSDAVQNISAKYFVRCKQVDLSNPHINNENRRKLWEKSLELSSMIN
ncbi:MAG: SDR family oxidoreductase [Bacteroidetes bacterium]|nr:SDR family oxidoreductase [Bacteroidota bacterium]